MVVCTTQNHLVTTAIITLPNICVYSIASIHITLLRSSGGAEDNSNHSTSNIDHALIHIAQSMCNPFGYRSVYQCVFPRILCFNASMASTLSLVLPTRNASHNAISS